MPIFFPTHNFLNILIENTIESNFQTVAVCSILICLGAVKTWIVAKGRVQNKFLKMEIFHQGLPFFSSLIF
jgi:hypothetical protein